MENIKEFFKKYKIPVAFVIVLIGSFSIYLFASAENDIYDNQITIANATITNIIDGTANANESFDANDEAGNDSSNNNKIVRSFDSVTYQISYGLAYKPDTTLTQEQQNSDLNRNVIVDILIPTNIKTVVSNDGVNALDSTITVEGDTNYKYYSYQINDVHIAEVHNAEVILSNIIAQNGDVITPIIRVRESTDLAQPEIETSTNVTEINKLNVENVTVSAKEDYRVQLYTSNPQKNDNNTKFNTGAVVYLPSDDNKGIKGIQVPSSVIFNIQVAASEDDTFATINNNAAIANYKQELGIIVDGLPYAFDTNNGTATVENSTLNNNRISTFTIKIVNLKYHGDSVVLVGDKSEIYITSQLFTFENTKTSLVDSNRRDIVYTVNTDPNISNEISFTDNYNEFVGDYISSIEFSKDGSSFDEHGKSIYNYNEEFYIQNSISYGVTSGDKLTNGFTNYIKIDNDAFKIIDYGNDENQSIDYYLSFGEDVNHNTEVKYGVGEWNSTYFKLKDSRPSYCPSTIDNLTKEQLMDYYGGPCIEETSSVTWLDSLSAVSDANKSDKIIIFKLNVTDEFDKASLATVRLRAKAVNNISNVGNTFKIVSRGKTTFNGQEYYMSEIPKKSVSVQSADLRYQKSTFDNSVIIPDKSFVNNNETSNNIGNTALISAFKASVKDKVELFDAYVSKKDIFYSGMTDPITIEVTPSILKSDQNASIYEATVSVYLPEELEIYKMVGDKAYREGSGTEVQIDGHTYRKYLYDYTNEDINFENESASGTIPKLVLHAYISLSTPDNTTANIITRISGKLRTSAMLDSVYEDLTPVEKSQDVRNITLRSTKQINSIGKSDLTRIDTNGSYTFNMRATNVSSEAKNLSLLYILPYSGDGIGEGSKFSGSISVKLAENLPSGYSALYTKDNAKTLLNNELSSSSSTNWVQWTNPTSELNGATAIKIVPSSNIPVSGYFVGKNGINLVVKTKNNKEAEVYMNNFYMLNANAQICIYDDITDTDCSRTETGTESYSSNITSVSVYNRTISGYAFEDSDYSGLYNDEARLKDISVELYKLSATEFDANNPSASISSNDTLIKDGITNNEGYYKFDSLLAGNYYVKYKFNCEKYTVTEKNKKIEGSDTRDIDSDAQIVNGDDEKNCFAVSNIQSLNNDNVEAKHIDLGLRIRQNFDINMNKYITNVKVTTATGTDSYDYNKQSKVKIDVKNLKNASFRVTYLIEIENSKYFPGTIGNIIESIPEGMIFDPTLQENSGWYENDGKLYYANLSKTLIMPGEKYYITIVLDLVTQTGGDYINFVVANNLEIAPVTTKFVEPDYEEEEE